LQHLLEHLFVQGEVRHHLLEAAILVTRRSSATPIPTYRFFQA